MTRGTAPQTTTHKCEMRHKKDGVRERAAGGDGRGVRLRTMQVRRDRQGQRYGGKDKEDRDKRAGLYSVPSLPTQRPTEEAMHCPGKPLLGGAPCPWEAPAVCCVSSAVGLSLLTEVLNILIRDLRALQTPMINWGLPEQPMMVDNCKSQDTGTQRNITQSSKVIIMKTVPAKEIADGEALPLAGRRIYLHREPCRGKLVSTGL